MMIRVPCFRPPDGEVEEIAMKRSRLLSPARFALLFALGCFFLVAAPSRVLSQETAPEEPKKSDEPVKAEEPVVAQEMQAVPTPPSQDQIKAATESAGPHHPPTNLKKVGDHWTPY